MTQHKKTQKTHRKTRHAKHRRYPSQALYAELNVPTLAQTYAMSLLKLTCSLSTTYLDLPPQIHHQHNTRRNQLRLLQAIPINKSFYYHSPIYNATKFFNSLPMEVRQLSSSKQFYSEIKKWSTETC